MNIHVNKLQHFLTKCAEQFFCRAFMISYAIVAPQSSQGCTFADPSEPPIFASFNASVCCWAGCCCCCGAGVGVALPSCCPPGTIGSLSPVDFKKDGVCEREADEAKAAPPTA